ncbi:tetratricopeptide repeat protein [Limibacter armeniacum]|uniref:tetratricopeptide repeat protein n=1 Tax=Limibacter armeniacum TaxID=466084 RepID=UPI002FE6162A
MSRSQVIVLAASAVVVVGLALMPRAVVKNNNKQVEGTTAEAAAPAQKDTQPTTHQANIPAEVLSNIEAQKEVYNTAGDEREKRAGLDELIATFKEINRYDSAAYYAEQFSIEYPKSAYILKAGDIYYEAFTFALDAEKVAEMAKKTQQLFEKYLEANPKDLDVKVKLGMTYVPTANPMQGIAMIREVLNEEPDQKLALFNLGLLAIQSGQFDKGVGRFKRLTELDKEDMQSWFYLGLCYKETGKEAEAIEVLEHVKKNVKEPQIITSVNQYLEELKH